MLGKAIMFILTLQSFLHDRAWAWNTRTPLPLPSVRRISNVSATRTDPTGCIIGTGVGAVPKDSD